MTSILPGRETILTISIKELQGKLAGQTDESIKKFLENILEVEWLQQQEPKKLGELLVKVNCAIPSETSLKTLEIFKKIIPLITIPREDVGKIAESMSVHNPRLLKRIMLAKYSHLESDEEKHLYMLRDAYEQKFRKIADELMENPPLDHKTPGGSDLLDIVFRHGTIDDAKRVLEIYGKIKGEEALKECLKGKAGAIGNFLSNSNVDRLQWLIAIYTEKEMDPAEELIGCCHTTEMLDALLEAVPKENIEAALKKKGVKLLFSTLEYHHKVFNALLTLFDKSDIPLSPFFIETEHHGMALLDVACLYGRVGTVKFLLSRMDDQEKSTLLFRQNYGLRRPLEHCKYYDYNQTNGCLELIEAEMDRLVAASYREKRSEKNPFLAVLSDPGKFDEMYRLIKELIKQGEDVTNLGPRLLFEAAKCRDPRRNEIIELFLNAGADATQESTQYHGTPLLYLTSIGDVKSMKLLLENGANVHSNQKAPHHKEGYTALHYAVAHRKIDAVRLLLEYDLNPNYNAVNGMTAFLLAKLNKDEAILKLLGDEVGHGDPNKIIPLHIYRSVAVVTGINESGEEVVLMDSNGCFPEGFKNVTDQTFADACTRILNIELENPKKIHRHTSVSKDGQRKCVTEFHRFDLGKRLASIEIESFTKIAFTDKASMRRSAALILQNQLADLDDALTIEYEGITLLSSAIDKGSINHVAALLKHPSMCDVLNGDKLHKLLDKAAKKDPAFIAPFWEFIQGEQLSVRQAKKVMYIAAANDHKALFDHCYAIAFQNLKLATLYKVLGIAAERGNQEIFKVAFDEFFHPRRADEWKELEEEKQELLLELLNTAADGGYLFIRELLYPFIQRSDKIIKEEVWLSAEAGHQPYLDAILNEVKDRKDFYRKLLQKSLDAAISCGCFELGYHLLKLGARPFHYKTKIDTRPLNPKINKLATSDIPAGFDPLSCASRNAQEDSKYFDFIKHVLSPQETDEQTSEYFKHSPALLDAIQTLDEKTVMLLLKDGRINLDTTRFGKPALTLALARPKMAHLAKEIAKCHILQKLGKKEGKEFISNPTLPRLEKLFPNAIYAKMMCEALGKGVE